ncbi:MAG: 23S rRNA (guanosine(2251)-2'-O)-methyltransferase RlmB [Dehalococcoidia bacterium]|nr:23S rRNA (guanosine(2251)-2'-O)-methyltransferase RlmB [Dehalococcoidia bacterium]
MEIIEGRNPIIEALRANRSISKILIDKNVRNQGPIIQILELASSKGIGIMYADKKDIAKESSTGANQGIIALARAKEYIEINDLFDISRAKNENPLYLVLDGIEDPHNFGAILRTAEATGIHGVVIRERRAVGLTPAVIKASAGAVEYVSVARVSNIAQSIISLQKKNIWAIGIDMSGKTSYDRIDYRLPTAIIIGGEGRGISDLVKKRCDSLASIPMRGQIGSLNASVAAAVVMYEALKQRR